jgi:hypothetical protein
VGPRVPSATVRSHLRESDRNVCRLPRRLQPETLARRKRIVDRSKLMSDTWSKRTDEFRAAVVTRSAPIARSLRSRGFAPAQPRSRARTSSSAALLVGVSSEGSSVLRLAPVVRDGMDRRPKGPRRQCLIAPQGRPRASWEAIRNNTLNNTLKPPSHQTAARLGSCQAAGPGSAS